MNEQKNQFIPKITEQINDLQNNNADLWEQFKNLQSNETENVKLIKELENNTSEEFKDHEEQIQDLKEENMDLKNKISEQDERNKGQDEKINTLTIMMALLFLAFLTAFVYWLIRHYSCKSTTRTFGPLGFEPFVVLNLV